MGEAGRARWLIQEARSLLEEPFETPAGCVRMGRDVAVLVQPLAERAHGRFAVPVSVVPTGRPTADVAGWGVVLRTGGGRRTAAYVGRLGRHGQFAFRDVPAGECRVELWPAGAAIGAIAAAAPWAAEPRGEPGVAERQDYLAADGSLCVTLWMETAGRWHLVVEAPGPRGAAWLGRLVRIGLTRAGDRREDVFAVLGPDHPRAVLGLGLDRVVAVDPHLEEQPCPAADLASADAEALRRSVRRAGESGLRAWKGWLRGPEVPGAARAALEEAIADAEA